MTETQPTAHAPAATTAPTPTPKGRERRRDPRYSMSEPAQIELSTWSELVELYTKDISHDGVFIQTPHPPQVHTKLAIHLMLPDGTGRIRFQGEVVHVISSEQAGPHGTSGFGVHFEGMTQQARQILEQIVEEARMRAESPETIGPAIRRMIGARRPEPTKSQRLRATLDAATSRTDTDLLGLAESPSLEQVDRAFEQLAQRWHPKRNTEGTTPEELQLIKEIYTRIEAAYRRLRVAVAPPPPAANSRPTPTSTPRPSSVKASVKAPERVTPNAQPTPTARVTPNAQPTPTARVTPNAAQHKHRRLVSSALALLPEKRYQEAAELLSKALSLRPSHTKTEVLRAFVMARHAVHSRDLPGAKAHYEEVLRLDPEHAGAKKELLMLAALESPAY